MFKKILLLTLSAVSLSFGSISIQSSTTLDGYLYDMDIQFDFNNTISVNDFWVSGSTNSVLYYEHIMMKPSEDGWYEFSNYGSDLAVGSTNVYETQLLIYDSIPTNAIIDAPTALRLSHGYGFGLGLQQQEPPPSNLALSNFYGSVQLEANEEYYVVFTSFVPDAYGTLDVSVIGNNTVDFTVVPEPSTVALIGVSFLGLYLARSRK